MRNAGGESNRTGSADIEDSSNTQLAGQSRVGADAPASGEEEVGHTDPAFHAFFSERRPRLISEGESGDPVDGIEVGVVVDPFRREQRIPEHGQPVGQGIRGLAWLRAAERAGDQDANAKAEVRSHGCMLSEGFLHSFNPMSP